MLEHYPFSLPPLPYDYNALEPYIDQETVKIHHDRHFKAYIDNLNKALKPYPQLHCLSLCKLLCNLNTLPCKIREDVRNNGGGVYSHNLYFNTMGAEKDQRPYGSLMTALEECFGSLDGFKEKMKTSGIERFGSGWAWLVKDRCGGLRIISTPGHDTPLPCNLCPVLILDVWEHAYYLKYKNKRGDYIDNWFNVINWDEASKNYLKCFD